jgi:hypothetical protein
MNRTTAAVALLLAVPLVAQTDETQPLRFVWQPGQTWFERVTQTWTRKVDRKGSKDLVEVKDTAETTLEVHVAKVEKDIASLEVTMLRVRITAPEEKVNWDSGNKETKPGRYAGVAKVVGKTVVVRFDARGAMVDAGLPTEAAIDVWEWPWLEIRPALPESAPRIGMTWEPHVHDAVVFADKVDLTDKLAKYDKTTVTIEERRKESDKVLGDLRIAVVKDVATWVLDLATGATQEEVRERIESIGPSANPTNTHMTRRVRIPPPPERLRRDEPPVDKPK